MTRKPVVIEIKSAHSEHFTADSFESAIQSFLEFAMSFNKDSFGTKGSYFVGSGWAATQLYTLQSIIRNAREATERGGGYTDLLQRFITVTLNLLPQNLRLYAS